MRIRPTLMRLLTSGVIAVSAGALGATIAGAQSVPVDEPAPTGQPPQSPVEPPTNTGAAGNEAGHPPSLGLPATGTGVDAGADTATILAAATLLGTAGVASLKVATRKR